MTAFLLNADVGEGCDDSLIMPYLHAANIACGGHAGDDETMRRTLASAKAHDVLCGAHPGYPDRANFGRVTLAMPAQALDASVAQQIARLAALATAAGMRLAYVKPHGALNHDMLADSALFARLCAVVAAAEVDPVMMVPTNAGQAEQARIAKAHGLQIWWEVFADRAYEANGLLRARRHPDALHQTPARILVQLARIEAHGEIEAIDGSVLDIGHARTVCVHGDHPPSVAALRMREVA